MKALVVGGSRGIGKATVEQLLENNAEVIVAARTNDQISHLPVEFIELDIKGDVSALADISELDCMIYCPGSINLKPFKRLSEADFREDFELNVMGAVKCIQATEKLLKASKGSIVLFSTVAVQQGMTFHTSIAVAKGGVEGLTRSLAAEYAPNIRVNAIAPSLTETDLSESLLSNDKRRQASEERHPLKRIGQVEDIASMAIHLASNKGSWITGQVISVDGGMSRVR